MAAPSTAQKERAKETVSVKELAKVLRGNIQGLKSDEYNHLDVDPIADNYEGVFWDLAQATPRLNAQTLKRAAMQAFDASAQEADVFGARLAKTYQVIAERARKVKTFDRTPQNSAFNRLVKVYWQQHVRQEPGSTRSTGQRLLRSQQKSLRKQRAAEAGLPLEPPGTPPPKARRLNFTPWTEETSPRVWAEPSASAFPQLANPWEQVASEAASGLPAPAAGVSAQVDEQVSPAELPAADVPAQVEENLLPPAELPELPAELPAAADEQALPAEPAQDLALVSVPAPVQAAGRARAPGRRSRPLPQDMTAPLRDVRVVHTVLSLPVRSYVQARSKSPGSRRLIVEFRARDCSEQHRHLATEAAKRIQDGELGFQAGRALRQQLLVEHGHV